jgi:hypothetical protein
MGSLIVGNLQGTSRSGGQERISMSVDQSVRESRYTCTTCPCRDHAPSEVADDLPHGDCDAAVLLLPEVHRLDRGVATEPGLRQGMSRSTAERIPAGRVMKVMIHAGASRAARPKEHSDVSHASSITCPFRSTASLPGSRSRPKHPSATPASGSEWMFATRFWAKPGGSVGADNAFAERHEPGIGAEIMGANKFGPPGWQDDPELDGMVGPEPAVPHRRPSCSPTGRGHGSRWRVAPLSTSWTHPLPRRCGPPKKQPAAGTCASVAAATVVREFLAAGLVDHMHLVQVPIVLGRGVRVWDGLEGLEKDYDIEAVSTPSGVTHLTFTRSE